MGYDDRESLGDKETGARAALPIWIEFMRAAIAGKPNEEFAADVAQKKTVDSAVGKPAQPVKVVAPLVPDAAAVSQ